MQTRRRSIQKQKQHTKDRSPVQAAAKAAVKALRKESGSENQIQQSIALLISWLLCAPLWPVLFGSASQPLSSVAGMSARLSTKKPSASSPSLAEVGHVHIYRTERDRQLEDRLDSHQSLQGELVLSLVPDKEQDATLATISHW